MSRDSAVSAPQQASASHTASHSHAGMANSESEYEAIFGSPPPKSTAAPAPASTVDDFADIFNDVSVLQHPTKAEQVSNSAVSGNADAAVDAGSTSGGSSNSTIDALAADLLGMQIIIQR